MKAAIYNPYLDTLGGGELYTLGVGRVLADAGYGVDIGWKNTGIKTELEKRFGLDLTNVNFVADVKKGDGYEICFWLSDGSIPLMRARKNLLHFQVPFHGVNGRTLLNKMKLFRINKIICNSGFTKKIIDREYGVDSVVVYPPVWVEKYKPVKKENLILYVGRFSELKQVKGQAVLIKAFKRFFQSGFDHYKLALAGGVGVGGKQYFRRLKKSAKNYPIEFYENPDFKFITKLYGRAKFFWSAAGYGADSGREPEKLEHFGMTIVEAMASGCIPLVYNAGGHKEIIEDSLNGYKWDKIGTLSVLTKELIENRERAAAMSRQAIERAKDFSFPEFKQNLMKFL